MSTAACGSSCAESGLTGPACSSSSSPRLSSGGTAPASNTIGRGKSRRHRLGRPGVAPEVRELIRDMCRANPLWGAPRVHGELMKLGRNMPTAGPREAGTVNSDNGDISRVNGARSATGGACPGRSPSWDRFAPERPRRFRRSSRHACSRHRRCMPPADHDR